jgi:hypothetical protein
LYGVSFELHVTTSKNMSIAAVYSLGSHLDLYWRLLFINRQWEKKNQAPTKIICK